MIGFYGRGTRCRQLASVTIGNASERREYKKVSIAGHDEVSPAVHRQLEKHVIFRVAAGLDSISDRNYFGDAGQETKELLPLFDSDIGIERCP